MNTEKNELETLRLEFVRCSGWIFAMLVEKHQPGGFQPKDCGRRRFSINDLTQLSRNGETDAYRSRVERNEATYDTNF